MLTVTLEFTTDEARQMLTNAGLEVIRRPMPILVLTGFPGEHKLKMFNQWAVKNPYTGNWELLNEVFKKYLETKKTKVFLNPDKLEIFNLFER